MSWKTKFRRIKDFLLPGRKRRREQLSKLSQQIFNLETALAATQLGIETHAQSIAKIDSRSGDLSEQIGQFDPALEAIRHILVQHGLQLGTVQEQSQTLEKQISSGLQRLESLTNETSSLANIQAQKHAELEDGLKKELNENVSTIRGELRAVARLNDQLLEFENKFDAIGSKMDALEQIALERTANHEFHESEIAALHQYVKSLGMALESVGQRISNLNKQVEEQLYGVSQSIEGLSVESKKFAAEKDLYSNRLSELGVSIENCIHQFNNRMANLLDGFAELVKADSALKTCSDETDGILKFEENSVYRKSPRFCSESFSHYSHGLANTGLPFIYLDLKSIPRSGLHYFQRTVASLLEQRMSFCEWYNEPGCCQKMPCALTGFANGKNGSPASNLRMIKSHDFDLDDPVFPTGGVIRRRILIRDPLFSLTSWWSLDVLTRNAKLLGQHGISLAKINYLHESAVLDSAYAIIDSEGEIPVANELSSWLEAKAAYFLGFINKWGVDSERGNVVFYNRVNQSIEQLLMELLPHLPADARERIENWRRGDSDGFKSRTNPFSSSSKKITEFLDRNSGLFRETAEEILQADSTHLFRDSLESSGAFRTIA